MRTNEYMRIPIAIGTNEIAVFIRGVRMCSRISITFELFALLFLYTKIRNFNVLI